MTFWFWHYRVTLETCDLWDFWSEWWGDMTWPKNTYLHTYQFTYLTTYLPTYLCISIREHPKAKGATIGISDIWLWDTDYNTDNWEPGLMTIFVTWQLIVTLDSICNSCDVLNVFIAWHWIHIFRPNFCCQYYYVTEAKWRQCTQEFIASSLPPTLNGRVLKKGKVYQVEGMTMPESETNLQ